MTWREAFLRQARSDLLTYNLLQAGGADKCQIFHYLQMAGEKLAKAESDEALAGLRPNLSHTGFSGWLKSLRVSRQEARGFGYKSQIDFVIAVRSLIATATLIEQLAPKLANDRAQGRVPASVWAGLGVNAEYPWLGSTGLCVAPSDYEFPEAELKALSLVKLAALLDTRIARALGLDRIF